jgi:formylmethanofuran dehydrogenase subunit B
MGKDLHPSIMPFIYEKLKFHQSVKSFKDISTEEDYILRVSRTNGLSDVIVYISDAYHFSEFDYLSKNLSDGAFILIAKPESSFPTNVQHHAKENKIIIGKIGILLGALKVEEYWKYERPKKDY